MRPRRHYLGFVLILSMVLCLAGCTGSTTASSPGGGKGGKKGGGDVPVTVTKAIHKNVPVETQVIGNVEAYSTISVKAQVGGELTAVSFKEGDFVKKGDLLFEIDRRPYEAAVDQAVANVARSEAAFVQAQAQLARDEAQARYAQAQAARYNKLFEVGIISKDQAEQLSANADAVVQGVAADKAAIVSARATVVAGQAAVETARVQLSYLRIYSPIDGRTGNLNLKLGNVVTANTVDLVTINQVEPIYVTFGVPEAQLPTIKRYMAEQKLMVRAQPQDQAAREESGLLTFVDNNVDATTGTIKLKGTFDNHNRQLWPGQFVRVTLRLTTQANAVVVPNQAIQTGQNGSFVFVVKEDRTVESRPVTTGVRVDQEMVVEKGLEAGEVVVMEGQLRLAPGSRVVIREGRGGPGARSKT
jgi:multidrug efflux system membrane fusion protein